MNLDPHENVRAECDAAMRAYLEGGGTIERLPNGAMAASGWKSEHYDPSSHTAKQRSMRNREIAREEREARQRAKAAEPLPRVVRERPPAKPRIRKPPPRKVRLRNGPVAARDGTKNREALDALRGVKLTANALAALLGWGKPVTQARLQVLKGHGLVVSSGSKGNMRWTAK